jgi:triosephosphate isomerase
VDGIYPEFRSDTGKLIVAYEPVWAIGTGEAATAADAEEMASFIDRWFVERYEIASGSIPILYGGSANAGNAAEFLRQPHVDGLLVGSASLKAESFNGIIAAVREPGD